MLKTGGSVGLSGSRSGRGRSLLPCAWLVGKLVLPCANTPCAMHSASGASSSHTPASPDRVRSLLAIPAILADGAAFWATILRSDACATVNMNGQPLARQNCIPRLRRLRARRLPLGHRFLLGQ